MPNAPKLFRPHYYRPTQKIDRRPPASERGYDEAWRRLRIRYIKQNPWCKHCEQRGLKVRAEIVDHIEPLCERPEMRLTWKNLQSLCRSCHGVKTHADGRRQATQRPGEGQISAT